MNKFKIFLTVLISMLALFLGIIFIMRNDQPVAVDFVFLGAAEFSSGAWVLGSFFIGLCLAWLIALPGFLFGKWRIARQQKKIGAQLAELSLSSGEPSHGK